MTPLQPTSEMVMTNAVMQQTASRVHGGSVGDDDLLESSESDTRQFVTFIAGNEVFAVDMAPVQEIRWTLS